MTGKYPVVIARSNPVAPDPRVEKIARALQQDGYPVSVIAWDRSGTLDKISDMDGIKIQRLKIPAAYGNGIGNLPALLRWQAGLMVWLVKHHKQFQILHACDFDTILPALVCKMVWGKTVIYDIFDFYADHLRRTPEFLKNLIRKIDFWAIGKADGVILVDDARRQQIAGSKPRRCISVYNSPEDFFEKFRQPDAPDLTAGLRIAYVGLLQVERGIIEVLHVLQRHPDWHLDLAGFGGDEDRIVAIIAPMPNVTWHGRVSYDRALALSASADVLFATYDPSIANHRYSSANKVFEGMMLAKPVIAAHGTNMDRMIQAADCGIIIQYGNETELENAFELLANDPALRKQKGKNARRAYESVYRWENMQIRLNDLYRQILHER